MKGFALKVFLSVVYVMDNRAIGVFDSGLGGLSFVKELNSLLPSESILYLGDTGRVPYGTRTPETILKYTLQDIAFLKEKNVKLIVIACGTVSSVALPLISGVVLGDPLDNVICGSYVFDKLDFSAEYDESGDAVLFSGGSPVFGVVNAAVRRACSLCKNGKIGILGTSSTVKSRAYQKAISSVSTGIECFGVACPLFVPLVENGYTDHPVTRIIAQEYLEPLTAVPVDTIILACTHYPLLRKVIEEVAGSGIRLVDSGKQTAKFVAGYLEKQNIMASGKGENRYFVTDNEDSFSHVGSMFLGREIGSQVEKVTIDDL